jgi:hypothetical protein
MEEIILRYLEVIGLVIAAVGAVFFGFKQNQINKRLKELQDYISISLVPARDTQTNKFQLQIRNVGKANVYLYKYEVGAITNSYDRARLIAAGISNDTPFFIIPVPIGTINTEMEVRIYLKDEFDNRYLSTGGVIIDANPIIPPVSSPEEQVGSQPLQVPVMVGLRAWSYKTERYDWIL